jgi:hypothetical protein
MRRRTLVLSTYFLKRLSLSLAGVLYIIVALITWALLFPPGQATPDAEYYILVIGAFGGAITFLAALSIAARANKAAHFPLLVRLPSRIEYLAAALLSTLVYSTGLQLMLAVLALTRGPEFTLGRLLEIPPVWLATNILAAVLAMHASDFVTARWSRVYVYGILAILLLGQSAGEGVGRWLAARTATFSRFLLSEGLTSAGAAARTAADWLGDSGSTLLRTVFGFIFWPFRAIVDAVVNGHFDSTQALAPGIVLLYATILFMFAADFFAGKDLDFTE